MKYIELFAGCGGLSLGLESAGYDLFFANELSPMASETYAFNLLNEDLKEIAKRKDETPVRTRWISSKFSIDQIESRLRENPQNYPPYGSGYTELSEKLNDIRGNLLVGSIIELNKFLSAHKSLRNKIVDENVDLVSGGPPCQSFSLAGMRQLTNSRNTLPMDFAEFVGKVKPKIALLENVSGILRPFKAGGASYYAWFEVARAFAIQGYYPICLHINAKYVGTAQNRPRFILLSLREDVFKKLRDEVNVKGRKALNEVLNESMRFWEKEIAGKETNPFNDLNYYDIEKKSELFSDPIFSELRKYTLDSLYSVKDAIDDLRENRSKKSATNYANFIESEILCTRKIDETGYITANTKLRRSSKVPTMRFRLYQILAMATQKGSLKIEKETRKFLRNGKESDISESTLDYLRNSQIIYFEEKAKQNILTRKQMIEYLRALSTKKQTQRALIADKPAPAALSIPDDACHYDFKLPRTLTIREMARFQSFPDWFEFRSKETTGGQMRKFEVPQYTQIGNAVPPLLGKALGETIASILASSLKKNPIRSK